MGAGRKDTDKNRVASSTRGNSNNFIIIERKHRVIHTGYVLMIYDHVSRSQPRTFSFSLFALENWRVQMDRDKPRHLEITVAYRRRLRGANWHRFQLNLATNEKEKSRERKGGRKNSIVGSERNRDSVSPYFTSSLGKSTSCETDSIDRGCSALVDRFDSLFVERTH